MPSDSEIEQFFSRNIIGEIICYCDLDYDQDEMIEKLREFISLSINNAIEKIKNDQLTHDIASDHSPEKVEH